MDIKDTNSEEKYVLDRNLYRSIKKMDRVALEGLLNNVFESGRKKGNEEAVANVDDSAIDLRELEKDIKAIKGVGEKRAEEIMSLIEKHFGIQ
ncbi:MAG: hypothetical protein K5898_06935 [Ruminococcus sp.]|uniref:hypothetical protein n=1 Tax=Ruminococcus TaxID=1263 RepID=UPI0025E41459|nr:MULTISPECIES: hypothetical protein [Ruminococcus]MCR4794888.1 hypothetical protein [Ruminococcus sp.]